MNAVWYVPWAIMFLLCMSKRGITWAEMYRIWLLKYVASDVYKTMVHIIIFFLFLSIHIRDGCLEKWVSNDRH